MLTAVVRDRMSAMGNRVETCFRLQFPDGTHYQNRPGAPIFTIIMRRARAGLRVLLFGHVGLLESYFNGDVDVEGDFGQAFQVAFASGFDSDASPLVGLRNRWHELRFANRSIGQARANARFHYAIGTDFYRHWLDTSLMMYTCGYWKEGTASVEEAQVNKVEHVCRKIGLSRGETVVDIGCGFGGFMFHAFERHGAIPYGLNTTPEQVAAVEKEIHKRGLQGKVAVRLADFREVDRQYDKVVSIGVLEHAGRDQLAQVVKAHADFLKPGGLGMLHFIGHVGVRDTEFYIRKHVFPGGWIPSLAQTITEMERWGLEIVDIENLRRHYAFTLDAWAERFERSWESIHELDRKRFNDKFFRVWRTYLVSCAEMFRSHNSRTHLFQIVFGKGNISAKNYPMSRSFLYAER
jgi:cyclopropane-fatty-acyl-phospholipid synthase